MKLPSPETQLRTIKRKLRDTEVQRTSLKHQLENLRRGSSRVGKTISVFSGALDLDDRMRPALTMWAKELEDLCR